MYDVISIGSATVDVFAKTHSELVKIKTEKSTESLICYPSGAKILINNLQFLTGGGGTNTAVSFSRLGLRTGYLGHLGNDENGRNVLSELAREHIAFLGTRGKEQTNYSIILDSLEHDRTILAYKEASEKLQWKAVKGIVVKNGKQGKLTARWLYASSMLGDSFKTMLKLAEYASNNNNTNNNIKIAFNPSEYEARLGARALSPLLSKTSILVLNREEAALLLGNRFDDAVKIPIKTLLRSLFALGPRIVVVTEGKHGVHASDGAHSYFVPARTVKVVDTTGAGDAFASAFLAGMMQKNDMRFALQLGLINAESVIQHVGAKPGLLSWREAMAQLRKKQPKVTVQ